jgi:DNA-binding NarL/FixJ family response regulator
LQTAVEFAHIDATDAAGDRTPVRPRPLRLLPSVDAPALTEVFSALRTEPTLTVLSVAPVQSLASQIRRLQPDVIVFAVKNPGNAPWQHDTALRAAFTTTPALLLTSAVNTSARHLAADLAIGSVLPQNLTHRQLIAALHAAAAGLAVTLPASDRLAAPDPGDKNLREAALVEHLTARETAVLDRIAHGCGNKEIAAQLSISEHTVKFHVSSILAKLGAASRTEAVTIGILSGLVAI